MKLQNFSYGLILVATVVGVMNVFGLNWGWTRWQRLVNGDQPRLIHARQLAYQGAAPAASSIPQVVVGTPEFYNHPPISHRYTYRNEFPADRTKWQTLSLLDTQTGQETRLGDDNGAAVFGVMDERYLLWYFLCSASCSALPYGLYAHSFATGEDTLIAKRVGSSVYPQIAGNWVAFGNITGREVATLYAANLQTHETITLTQRLSTQGNAYISSYFGLSARLVAWYEPKTIVIYDLSAHRELVRLTDFATVFNDPYLPVSELTPGETVVTWSKMYGYDLVTRSYFRIKNVKPADWGNALIENMSRIDEENRVLSWSFDMQDGTHRHVRAPLLDATPSAAPCVEGQNLVQNGDLENVATHNVWQQSGNPSELIVNELPPNSPQAGQWAIRLGRYSNAQPTIQQTLNIPSGVKHITLAFDVRASSWDIWGGDQLQVDLIDPITNQSILATPVQWTNRQLASGGWIPLQVDIQAWPGIDTPLQLVFRARTDWAFPTDFTIDNIRFITSCQ